MKAYSKDLCQKVVQAVKPGTSVVPGCLFSISLSSVKRYLRLANQEKSITPRKGGGRPPDAEEATKNPPQLHTDSSLRGPFPQEYTYIFEEAVGDGTRCAQVLEGEPGCFFILAGVLLEMAGRRQFRPT
jgi:hypothetical protein